MCECNGHCECDKGQTPCTCPKPGSNVDWRTEAWNYFDDLGTFYFRGTVLDS